MKRPAVKILGLVFWALCISPNPKAKVSDSASSPNLPSRLIDIHFFVDNENLLEKKFLELAVREDKFRRRLIKILPRENKSGEGLAEIPVPEGPINVVVCGFVNCGGAAPSEMFCGESEIPSYLEVDKIHEIHFSTKWACEQAVVSKGIPPNLGFAKAK